MRDIIFKKDAMLQYNNWATDNLKIHNKITKNKESDAAK